MVARRAMHWKCRAYDSCQRENFIKPEFFHLTRLHCICGKEMNRIRVVRIE